jgi:maleylpyruvate isomerase
MSARDWAAEGTRLFLAAVDRLGDDEFATGTPLPGWTRAHVIAHVHHNALALGRLASWAATGTEQRMYASVEQRDAEIAESARLAPADLRAQVHASAEQLTAALDGLSPQAWRAEVITAQGRTVPATEIPWMRAREVCVHAVDLDTGVSFADLPPGFTAALVGEVAARRAAGDEGPALAAWLTGRAAEAPALGRWL